MNQQEIIARLRDNEAAFRARGVAHAALFGSRARGDARPDSDTDIMVELDPAAHFGVWRYSGVKAYLTTLFDRPVDVVDRDALKPSIAPPQRPTRSLPFDAAAVRCWLRDNAPIRESFSYTSKARRSTN